MWIFEKRTIHILFYSIFSHTIDPQSRETKNYTFFSIVRASQYINWCSIHMITNLIVLVCECVIRKLKFWKLNVLGICTQSLCKRLTFILELKSTLTVCGAHLIGVIDDDWAWKSAATETCLQVYQFQCLKTSCSIINQQKTSTYTKHALIHIDMCAKKVNVIYIRKHKNENTHTHKPQLNTWCGW